MVHGYVTKKSLNSVRKKAEKGDMVAQCYLGVSYLDGQGVEKDVNEGLKWLKMSADQNYEIALVALGRFYMYGVDVDRDVDKATKCFRKAAENGNSEAQLYLGQILLYDKDVEQNEAEGIFWLKKSAEDGCPVANINMCELYHNGKTDWSLDQFKASMEQTKLKSYPCEECENFIETGERLKCFFGKAK